MRRVSSLMEAKSAKGGAFTPERGRQCQRRPLPFCSRRSIDNNSNSGLAFLLPLFFCLCVCSQQGPSAS